MFLLLAFLFSGYATFAEASFYEAIPEESSITFEYFFGKQAFRGKVKNFNVKADVDFKRVRNSNISASLETTTMTAGFLFATEALRSPRVLDVKNFPEIQFEATKITGTIPNVEILGNATIKGTTKPIKLNATWLRPAGTEPDELETLVLNIVGTLDRFEFGVNGYRKEVAALLKFNMRIVIRRVQ